MFVPFLVVEFFFATRGSEGAAANGAFLLSAVVAILFYKTPLRMNLGPNRRSGPARPLTPTERLTRGLVARQNATQYVFAKKAVGGGGGGGGMRSCIPLCRFSPDNVSICAVVVNCCCCAAAAAAAAEVVASVAAAAAKNRAAYGIPVGQRFRL